MEGNGGWNHIAAQPIYTIRERVKEGGSYVTRERSHTGKMQGGSKNTFGKSVTTL